MERDPIFLQITWDNVADEARARSRRAILLRRAGDPQQQEAADLWAHVATTIDKAIAHERVLQRVPLTR